MGVTVRDRVSLLLALDTLNGHHAHQLLQHELASVAVVEREGERHLLRDGDRVRDRDRVRARVRVRVRVSHRGDEGG